MFSEETTLIKLLVWPDKNPTDRVKLGKTDANC